jgi:hypothetical protein
MLTKEQVESMVGNDYVWREEGVRVYVHTAKWNEGKGYVCFNIYLRGDLLSKPISDTYWGDGGLDLTHLYELRNMDGSELFTHEEPPPINEHDFHNKNAWVSPKGDFITDHPEFEEKYAFHFELGACILKDMFDWESKYEAWEHKDASRYVIETLEKKKWIRLHSFAGSSPKWVVPEGTKITTQQENTILKWCIANKKKFTESIIG